MTQVDFARRVGVSRAVIWRIERGRADRVVVRTLERVAAALDARIDVRLLWHGEGLDRLLDARHASLVEQVVRVLQADGWEVATEVSFNIRGERGSIDVLAFRLETRTLLVVEIKSVVPDMQSMLMSLDRKARLAIEIARRRGWIGDRVGRVLILPANRTSRRRVADHAATFATDLPARTAEVRAWLQRPEGSIRGILFVANAREESNRLGPARRPSATPVPTRSTQRVPGPDD